MIPPSITRLTDSSENTTDAPEHRQLTANLDSESLGRHQRRPSSISRARYTLATIAESVSSLTEYLEGGPMRLLDGDIVDEPNEGISLEQFSPPQTPRTGTPPSSNRGSRRPPLQRSRSRQPSLSPEISPRPSDLHPKRPNRAFSSHQVPAVDDIPEEGDDEALAYIWRTYAQEAIKFDHRRMSHLHKILDVILVFSAIFSAIITPFIAESYKLLVGQKPSPPFFGQDGYTVRVNAMWFGSLILSLIAGLFSIHCKMWLDGYGVDLVFAGAAKEGLINACRLRQYRYQGLHKYRMLQIIGVPPLLLYASLAFFALGLIDFLWHLNQGIAIYVSVICVLVLVFHVSTTITPCFTTGSPFKTPLSNLVGNLWRAMRQHRPPKGLLERNERDDVASMGAKLDADSFEWLMEHTQSEEVYVDAMKAKREYFLRRQSKASTPSAYNSVTMV